MKTENELLKNLDKLHTTELGVIRIKRNLSLDTDDVVDNIGSMDKIYKTYEKIYKEILPNSGYVPIQSEFLHFEKYEYCFHWKEI